ncbi:MAG: acyl-CoA dehydrogenase [Marmoricola sp.]|nr:acyl-CoA dehydrogenase [Marmoricola sp.]
MQWELAEEQTAFQASFSGWLQRVAPGDVVRSWAEADEHGPFEQLLAEEGWCGVGSGEAFGGQGGGLVELALAAEELGRTAAPSSGWMGAVLAAPALGEFAEIAQGSLERAEFVVLAVAADAQPDRTTKVVATDGHVSGTVSNVLGGDRASYFVTPALDGSQIRLYLVAADDAGTHRDRRMLLDRSRSAADVTFEDAVAVPLDVDADEFLADAALRAAVLVSADALGASERMLDLAVEYSKQRHQFGAPIGSFQAVKHAAASILVDVEAARSVVFFAAASVDELHADRGLHAASAKAQVTAQAVKAADGALTIHGAIGYTQEHDLQFFYKRAKLDQRLFGSPAAWNERIAGLLDLAGASTS